MTGRLAWSARIALVTLCALVTGCSARTSTATSPATASPAPASSTSPSTPTATLAAATAGPALAVVPVQVTYVLRSLRPSLDSLFPVRDSLDRAACEVAAGLVCHQYVYRRDSLAMRSTGDRLTIDARLSYRAKLGTVGVSRVASCGYAPEPMRRATLTMSTSLYWRRDWRIGARESAAAATLVDACRVTVLGVDATVSLRNLINGQLQTFAAAADTAIPVTADLRPLADSLWRSFIEPTALDTLGTLWLLFEPEAIRVTPLVGNGPSIRTAIVLYARPRVIAGGKPRVTMRPLPDVALGEAPSGFDVPLTVELPFAELERRAELLLAGETATGSVRVDSVHVRGLGDSLAIDLQVSGAIRGTLTLATRLRWDNTARELRLDDLQWNLASRGALSRVKATLGAPLVSRAVRRATSGGRVPLGAQLDSARTELLRLLNGTVAPGIALGSSVNPLQILGVRATSTAIVVSARLTGRAGVWIQ